MTAGRRGLAALQVKEDEEECQAGTGEPGDPVVFPQAGGDAEVDAPAAVEGLAVAEGAEQGDGGRAPSV